jgi:putative ABC transport system permease protein
MTEPYRVVPVRVRNRGVVRTVALTGLRGDAALRRIVDDRGAAYALPPRGVTMSAGLAALLDLRAGDTLRLELLERGEAVRHVPVAGVARELVGMNIYLQQDALDALLGEHGQASGVHLRVDPAAQPAVMARLKTIPAVAGASSRQALIDAFDRQMIEGIRISGSIIVVFAVIIALGVVYNGARVSLSERGRELASLRVLGFTQREVAGLLYGEQAILIGIALPIGVLVGMGLMRLITTAFAAEDHYFPMLVEPGTYVGAAGIVIVSAILAALLMRRRLDRMDLIAVLKTRE